MIMPVRTGWTLLALVTLAVVGLIVAITYSNHQNAAHQQRIANCVVATGDTWAQCAKFQP
jgi:hypothetical protein